MTQPPLPSGWQQYPAQPQPQQWPPASALPTQGWAAPQPTPPAPQKRRRWPWVAGAVVLLLAAVVGVSAQSSRTAQTLAREWELVAKDPGSHVGKRVVVYGKVTQFDPATGTDGFRASVDGVEHEPEYGHVEYDTNTRLDGNEALLREVVNGDLFRAETTVAGTYTYMTTRGEKLTVPRLQVTKIDVIGYLS